MLLYYHASTYYSANFDRVGRHKTDLYFKTRQSDDVTARRRLFYDITKWLTTHGS